MFLSKDHPQAATLSLLKSLLKLVTDCFRYNLGSVAACLVVLLKVPECGCASCALQQSTGLEVEFHAF